MSRRLALVIGSQCPALGTLSFLPAGAGPVELGGLPEPQRLLVRLRDLLVDGPGQCAPVLVPDQSGPGLLLNPAKASADAALIEAIRQAHKQQAVLMVYFLGHGRGLQADPAAPARHLLHLWDTRRKPVDTEPESNGWDPYELVVRRRRYARKMVGFVLLVDACWAAWAKQQVDAWSGVRGGLLSAWLGSSGDQQAWDACFTRTLIKLLEHGVSAGDHPRGAPLPELLAADIQPLVGRACPSQTPRLGGYESHNPVLWVARNRRASELAAELGIDGVTETLLLRLTSNYVSFAVQPVVEAAQAGRVVVVIGGPGMGKSTLAAALRHPPRDDVPLAVVQAVAFAAAASSVPELARVLRGQLERLPHFPVAARRYQTANTARWDSLDIWQREITGPLSVYPQPVRLLLDGLDQLDGRPEQPTVARALTDLITDPRLGHVSLLLTSRTKPDLPGIDTVVAMPGLNEDTARRYLATRHLTGDLPHRLVKLAAGSWLVLTLAADLASRIGTVAADNITDLYTDLLARVRDRHGQHTGPVLAVLAAAGPGPVLPFDLLTDAIGRLAPPLSRAQLHALLGDPDLYPLFDRTRPGRTNEHLGLFHQTLINHILAHADARQIHQAIVDSLDQLAPAERHNPKTYRTDPLLAYAFAAGPRHRWQAGRPELLVNDLAKREDPIPRINLTRWAGWATPIHDSLGPDHPDTLSTRHQIAYWTGKAGDPTEALRLFRELLPDRQRVLGPDHPATLTTRHNIAFLTGEVGDPAGALRLCRELLPNVERVLGPDHPTTLNTRDNIAGWIGKAGDPTEALRLFRELLPDRQRVLGPD
ncbi:MAG: tetratricopeptide repeat protein, partial [Actinomycetota bacterium]|nr:tetratricopeptide repeat protein [Actinomycetota bacterium]